MDEKYYDCYNFIYEDSEDISIRVSYYKEDPIHPIMDKTFTSSDFKKAVGMNKAFHIELPIGFEIAIHAIKDNYIYVSLYEMTSENSYKRIESFALSKRFPRYNGSLIFQGKINEGNYTISVVEWGKLKSGLRVMV